MEGASGGHGAAGLLATDPSVRSKVGDRNPDADAKARLIFRVQVQSLAVHKSSRGQNSHTLLRKKNYAESRNDRQIYDLEVPVVKRLYVFFFFLQVNYV